MSKLLITHVKFDVSHLNDRQIEAYKEMIAATIESNDTIKSIRFEVEEIDENQRIRQLLRAVRNEFAERDAAHKDTNEPTE